MDALIVAISAAAIGLVGNIIQRAIEARQRKLLSLIDEIGREVVLTERMVYRARLLAIETIESGKLFSRLETERRLFDDIVQESELGNLSLKLKNENVDPMDFVISTHTMRQFCLEFLREYVPSATELPVRKTFPPLRAELRGYLPSAQKLTKRLGRKLSLMHTITGV